MYGTTPDESAEESAPSSDQPTPGAESQGLLQVMHYTNLLNALLLAVTAFMIILTVFKGQIAEAFIAVYILLFSCMLLAFELRLGSYEVLQ